MKKIILLSLSIFIAASLYSEIRLSSPADSYGAATGYNKSVSAIYYNPSFTTFVENSMIGFGFMRFYNPALFYNFYISYQKKINKNGTGGILWSRFNSAGDISYLDYLEDTFLISYAHIVAKYFRPGGYLKIKNINTDSGSGMGYSITLSFMFIPIDNYYISLIFYDVISSALRWSTKLEEDFDRKFVISNGYKLNLNYINIIFSVDYLVNNIKIKDYVISSDYKYPFVRAGICLTYNILKFSAGIVKDEYYKFTTGIGINIIDSGVLGINYRDAGTDLGYTYGAYFEYKY